MLFLKTEDTDPNRNVMVRLTRRLFPVTARFHGSTSSFARARPHRTRAKSPVRPHSSTMSSRPLDRGHCSLRRSRWRSSWLRRQMSSSRWTRSRRFFHYERPIPGVHQQRIRDPGSPVALFALAGMVNKFRYLKVSLALVLMLVGVKMLLAEWLKVALGRHLTCTC